MEQKRLAFCFKDYTNTNEYYIEGTRLLRWHDGYPGSVRLISEKDDENQILAYGLIAMYFEYINYK